jgi:hypothetical protein
MNNAAITRLHSTHVSMNMPLVNGFTSPALRLITFPILRTPSFLPTSTSLDLPTYLPTYLPTSAALATLIQTEYCFTLPYKR